MKFLDGATLIGTVALSGGSASFATHTLAAGSHSITADYSGDSTYNASNSAALAETINKATSVTALIASVNPSSFNQVVTFTAKVTSPGGIPAGTVTFKNGGTTMGTGTLSGGVATFATSALAVGTHSITAVYGGSVDFDTSTSSASSEVTDAAKTTTKVVSSLNPSQFEQSVTFTATVTPATAGTVTGTVTFKDGATTLGSATLSGGVATFATSAMAVGTHSITAVYGGSVDFGTSTSAALSEVTDAAKTTTKVVSSLNPSKYGQSVSFTATVTPGTSGTATGTVTFKNGAVTLGTATLSGGKASFATGTLTAGAHSITAVYGGSTDYQTSTSAALSQTVDLATTTTTLTSSLNPSTHGTTVTFTAKVSAATGPIPTGTVTFKNGSTSIGTGTLNSAGDATFATSALTVGTHSMTAVYGGSADDLTSTSSSLSQVIK
jgi:predicted secreted protein